MITKFERKVIAGLTAFLMCLSMIFAVPVSVNAEAEQTQDEAVSGAQQNEDVEDIQIPDSQEDVLHDIIEVDETGDAAKKNEDHLTAPYEEETRTPQMLNVDRQENVAGTITLKKDGTPEYGEAAFSTEQTTVRYRLNVEEDGQYYFELIRDWSVNAYISIIEKKEYGDTWLSGEESRYELHKGGEYYLEITNNSAESVQTLKWYAGKVRDIKPGEFEAELSENVKSIYYNLTVDETGWYRFDSGSLSMGIKDKETGEYISSWSFCKLESGHTYYITVSKSEVNPGTSSKWSVKKGKAISVELGQVNRNENSKEVYYVFVPETTGKYVVKEWASIYDETWKNIEDKNGSAQMTAGNSYYITVDGAQYWSIQKYEESEKETIEVQTGTTYTTPFDKNKEINYTFTPDDTGVYRFKSQQSDLYLDMKNYDGITGYGTKSGKINFFALLEKGKTYEFSIFGYGFSEVSWNITKASVKTVEEGTAYTMTKEETTVYDFVPSKSGEYMFSSKDGGTGKVYSSDWKEIEGYLYDGAAEFGMKVSLEQGKTYHLGIALSDKEAKWKIEPVKESSDYTYRVLSDNTVEILKYSGAESNVTVPDKIDNKVVKSVGYGAFAENENIVGVTIPAQVTDLQYGVFASCANLETVTFKEGSKLQKIAARAFENCSKLHSVSLPDSVQTIEENGFAYCKDLGSVDLGNGLKNIEQYAFYDSGVTRIHIPDSTTEIGASTFSACRSLNDITLGSGLKGIEYGVFYHCSNLKQIEIPDNITYISDEAFDSSGLTSVEIPDSVTSIGKLAFYGCQSLKKAVIGNNLAYIADNAFSSCALTEIMWGDKVEKIGESAFAQNKNLTTVSIPNSVTKIEYGAFAGCENLSNIEIPDSVEAIGGFAFESDINPGSTAWYEAQADGDVYAGKVYYKYKGEAPTDTTVTIKDGTKGIAGYAFYMQRNVTEVVIPNSVNNIGEVAFMGCESLKTVTIPESVKVIGREAFGYLSSKKYEQGYKVEGFTIRGVAGSAAEKYAKENGFTFEAIKPDYIKGDSDSDGKVTISDVRTTLRYVCQKVELDEEQKLAADVEKDGVINIKDLRKVLRFVCNKIEEL